jgi:hypothetical protein
MVKPVLGKTLVLINNIVLAQAIEAYGGNRRAGPCLGSARGVESESVKMYRLRPQSKILTRYSNPRAVIATVTIRLVLKYRL